MVCGAVLGGFCGLSTNGHDESRLRLCSFAQLDQRSNGSRPNFEFMRADPARVPELQKAAAARFDHLCDSIFAPDPDPDLPVNVS
jgi:hypothetical protein